jgi:autotransporter passenger strand-loop-strand repeat protein
VAKTTILSAGALMVLSGGIANGMTVSSGGTAQIANGAVVKGAISATGEGATLVVDDHIVGGIVLGSGAQMDPELGQVSGALKVVHGRR